MNDQVNVTVYPSALKVGDLLLTVEGNYQEITNIEELAGYYHLNLSGHSEKLHLNPYNRVKIRRKNYQGVVIRNHSKRLGGLSIE